MNFFTEVRDKIVCIIFNKGVSVPEEHASVFMKGYIKQQNIFIVAMKQHFLQVLLLH